MRRRGGLVAGLAAALLAVGCSGDEEKQPEPKAATEERSGDPSAIETDTGPSTVEAAEPPPEGKSLGSARGSILGSTLEVTALERTSEEVVTARFRISVPEDAGNDFQISGRLASPETSGQPEGQDTVSGATLTDEAGGKRYFVLTDTEDNCLCSTDIAGDGFIDPGATVELFAKFPAPPEDVKEVSFFLPTFQSIDGVPISG